MKTAGGTRLRKCWKVSFGLAAVVLLSVGTAVAQTKYTVTDLGTLGGTFGVGIGINNRGWVSGYSALPGDQKQHATLWVPGLKPIDLGTLGGPNSNNFSSLTRRAKLQAGQRLPLQIQTGRILAVSVPT